MRRLWWMITMGRMARTIRTHCAHEITVGDLRNNLKYFALIAVDWKRIIIAVAWRWPEWERNNAVQVIHLIKLARIQIANSPMLNSYFSYCYFESPLSRSAQVNCVESMVNYDGEFPSLFMEVHHCTSMSMGPKIILLLNASDHKLNTEGVGLWCHNRVVAKFALIKICWGILHLAGGKNIWNDFDPAIWVW